jgi:hypothetical protein
MRKYCCCGCLDEGCNAGAHSAAAAAAPPAAKHARRAFKLDLRPTALRVLSPPPDASLDALRAHFSYFGDVTACEAEPSEPSELSDRAAAAAAATNDARAVTVRFGSRAAAEAALAKGAAFGEGALLLEWAPAVAATLQPDVTTSCILSGQA